MKISILTPIKADTEEKALWLLEAIQSVKAQTHSDWEMRIVNDRSDIKFSDFKDLAYAMGDDRIVGLKAEDYGISGVAAARNLAAEMSTGEVLLPLDADDLLPNYALKVLDEAWRQKPGGILYGHTEIRQNNSSRIHRARPYSFPLLLRALMMPVGCLHAKKDWEAVGGWSPEMDGGLEDWEYWIKLGKAGVCGKGINRVLYIYRRHARSRLTQLRSSGTYEDAFQKMRSRHEDVYSGRFPVKCCGGSLPKRRLRRLDPGPSQLQRQMAEAQAMSVTVPDGDIAQVIYTGDMRGSWGVHGKESGISYRVHGPGQLLMMPDGRPGVDRRDLPYILSMYRGRAFKLAP